MGRTKKPSTIESTIISTGKKGISFYTDKPDKTITALGSYYKKDLITERLITVTTGGKIPVCKYITKVTLI